jgi:hypothetical protein
MQQDGRVLADGIHHHRTLETGRDLAENLDALGLEGLQVAEPAGAGIIHLRWEFVLQRAVKYAFGHGPASAARRPEKSGIAPVCAGTIRKRSRFSPERNTGNGKAAPASQTKIYFC